MKTEALIESLTRDVQPVRSKPVALHLASAGAVGLAMAFLGVLFVYGVRSDLSEAVVAVFAKAAFCLAGLLVAAPLLYRLSRPSTRVRAWFAPVLLLCAMSLGIAAIVVGQTPPEARLHAWIDAGVPACLQRIPLLAVPVAAALLFVVRGLAPTRLTFAGAALGGVAGAIAGIAYSWFCPVDSISYVATWYLAAILLCAGIGALLGRWLLRW